MKEGRGMMIRDVDSFYWALFLAITICIFFELISFLIHDLHMAVAFRSMIMLILSFPVANKFIIGPFACAYNNPLLNRLLTWIFAEDLMVFFFIMKGHYMVYYVMMVFSPYLIVFSLSNKDSLHFYINKILPPPQTIV
jgi:hypothetical protein